MILCAQTDSDCERMVVSGRLGAMGTSPKIDTCALDRDWVCGNSATVAIAIDFWLFGVKL